VHIDGKGRYFALPNFMGTSDAGDIYVVLRSTGAPGSYAGLWIMSGGQTTLYPAPDGTVQEAFGTNQEYNTGTPPVVLSSYHIYNVSAEAGLWQNRFNGIVQFTALNNFVLFDPTSVLGAGDGVSFTGDVAELLAFNRVLTEDERQSVGQYLQSKYNLATPPTTPTGFSATASSPNSITVSWQPVSGADVYSLERSLDGINFTPVDLIDAPTASYVDYGVPTGGTVTYQVQAISYAGISPFTSTISIASPSTDLNGDGIPDYIDQRIGIDPTVPIGNALPASPTPTPVPTPPPADPSPIVITLLAPPGATLN
jgi:hypothetical protein